MTVTYRDPAVTYRSATVTWRGGVVSDLPVFTVEVAFANNPGDTSLTWVDITSYVESGRTHHGRKSELDRFEAGTARLVLFNDDRRFDPTYTAGPNYGNLLPRRRIRVTARWDGTTYPIFSGLVDSWPQSYSDGGLRSTVTLRCTDLFKSLANMRIIQSFPSESTGARVARVLDALGWPAADRSISTGQSTVQAVAFDGKALDHLLEVNDSENGLLYVARDGKFTFVDRDTLILAAQDPTLVWGEGVGEYPYTGITVDPQDAFLFNDWTVSAPGLTSQIAQSATSITQFLTLSESRSTVLADTGQMVDLANFLVGRFSQPQDRIVGLTMNGLPTTTFAPLLAREIGDKIRVHRRPAVGDVIEQDSIIEAISVQFAQRQWQFQFDLSPVDAISNYWILGDTTQSVLDTTTRLGY